MNITPYVKHIIVTPDPEVEERTTKGGIIVKDKYTKRDNMEVHLRWGKVEAVGLETEPIKVGMRVAYNPFDGYDVPGGFAVIPMAGIRACCE